METGQMTTIFYLLFLLWLFVSFISEFENTQNSFLFAPLLRYILVCKYLNFLPKATDSDSSSYFPRKQTPWGY